MIELEVSRILAPNLPHTVEELRARSSFSPFVVQQARDLETCGLQGSSPSQSGA